MNEDAQIDWQDGAVSYRSIMNNPYKMRRSSGTGSIPYAMNLVDRLRTRS